MNFRRPRILNLLFALVIAYAIVRGVAFIQLYRVPHSYEAASTWIFENIPPGSKLLGPHWDDRLPVTLPGFSPHDDRYNYEYECRTCELPFYEADTVATLDTLTSRMAEGDYIIFPTPRIQGSIPRIPEEYPRTTALLQLLWSGQLGYQLVHSVKATPNFMGIEFGDDLADESLSVYDHPKVVIFKNTERLSSQEIRSRVLNATAFGPLPSLQQILLTNEASDRDGYGAAERSLVLVALFASGLVVLLAILVQPIVLPGSWSFGVGIVMLPALLLYGIPLGIFSVFLPIYQTTNSLRVVFVVVCATLIVHAIKMKLRGEQVSATLSLDSGWRASGEAIALSLIAAVSTAIISSSGWGGALFNLDEIAAIFTVADRVPQLNSDLSSSSLFVVSAWPLFLSLLWPGKVVGVSSQHVFPVCLAVFAAVTVSFLYATVLSTSLFRGRSSRCIVGLLMTGAVVYLVNGGIAPQADLSSVAPSSGDHRSSIEIEELIRWSNERISGVPRILTYSNEESLSFAIATGLPGPSPFPGISDEQFQQLVHEVYAGEDLGAAYSAAVARGIELIIVGGPELARYGEELSSRFEQKPDLFAKIFSGREIKVYALARSPLFSESFAALP